MVIKNNAIKLTAQAKLINQRISVVEAAGQSMTQSGDLYYKTFYGRNLWIFVIS